MNIYNYTLCLLQIAIKATCSRQSTVEIKSRNSGFVVILKHAAAVMGWKFTCSQINLHYQFNAHTHTSR